MNYQKHYDLLISSRLKLQEERNNFKKLKNIFDRHHIKPKCLGGTNDKSNLILLTYREHYIAHWLLTKIHSKENKLVFALWRLSNINNKYVGHNSKKYDISRTKFIESISGDNNPNRQYIGNTHPNYGKKHSAEAKLKMSKAAMGRKNRLGKTGPHLKKSIPKSIPMTLETRLKISNSHRGKPKTNIHKQNLSKSARGVAKSKIAKYNMSKNNWLKNINPWEHPSIKRNNLSYNWSRLDKIYDIWITNNKCGYGKLCSLSIEYDNKLLITQSFNTMIKWFLEHGDPRNHSDWLKFKLIV